MHNHTVCILGGSGFVGSHLATRLAKEGYIIRLLTRRKSRHQSLMVLPQLQLVEADIHDEKQLAQHFLGCDIVINLVGILHDGRGRQSFRAVHEELPARVVRACHAAHVHRLLHMSALHADAGGPSLYLRSKGQGENQVFALAGKNLVVTSFRPSVIFGPGDSFLNRFANLLKILPLPFPLACPLARFQPVYVGDVVDAFCKAIHDPQSYGKRIALCGPRVYTLKELLELTAKFAGVKRWIIGLPDWASRLQAAILQWLPGKPFTLDNYRSMQVDSICKDNRPCSTPLEVIAPQYIGAGNRDSLIQRWRETARS
jgi:NADH dehydrogenase